MKQRPLRPKEMPSADSAIRAVLAELEQLFLRLPSPRDNRKVRNLLAVLVKKRFELSFLQNKTKVTARTFQFTVVFKPKPWLLKLVKTLRCMARDCDRKIKRR